MFFKKKTPPAAELDFLPLEEVDAALEGVDSMPTLGESVADRLAESESRAAEETEQSTEVE